MTIFLLEGSVCHISDPQMPKTRECLCIAQGKTVQVVQELHLYASSCGEFVGKIQLRNDSAFERLQMCQLCRINLLVSCFMKGILMQIETKFSIFKCFIDFKAFFH